MATVSQHPVSIPHVSSFEIIFFFLFLLLFLSLSFSLPLSLSPFRPLAGTSLFLPFALYTRAFLERGSDDSRTNHKEGDIYTTAHAVEFTVPAGSFSSSFETIIGRVIFTGVNESHRRFATRMDPLATIEIPDSWFLVLRFYCFLLLSLLLLETFIFKRLRLPESSKGKRVESIVKSNRSKIFQKSYEIGEKLEYRIERYYHKRGLKFVTRTYRNQ